MKVSLQAALVRNHLFTEAHLTSWQAEGVYRIRRLASRISELKNAGYEIEKARCTDATGQPYTRYSFSKAQKRRRKPVNQAVKSQSRFTVAEAAEAYHDFCCHVLDLSGAEATEESQSFALFLGERA